MIHIPNTYRSSLNSVPFHDQQWQMFGLLRGTLQQNDCTSSTFFVTLIPCDLWVKVKVINLEISIILTNLLPHIFVTLNGHSNQYQTLQFSVVRHTKFERMSKSVSVSQQHWSVVCWLLNVTETCECVSGTDLLRQFYVLPHWDRNCRQNFPSHPVTVYWHWTDQSQHWAYIARHLAG